LSDRVLASQPWYAISGPARWILELAHGRNAGAKARGRRRAAAGDTGFAEALELMAFLATWIRQNIERHSECRRWRESHQLERLGEPGIAGGSPLGDHAL